MNKDIIKANAKEFNAWLKGEEVYFYAQGQWIRCDMDYQWNKNCPIVIKDKFFEARKTWAFGNNIKGRANDADDWTIINPEESQPSWNPVYQFEPILPEPKEEPKTLVFEEWLFQNGENEYIIDIVESSILNDVPSWFTPIKKLSERTVILD